MRVNDGQICKVDTPGRVLHEGGGGGKSLQTYKAFLLWKYDKFFTFAHISQLRELSGRDVLRVLLLHRDHLDELLRTLGCAVTSPSVLLEFQAAVNERKRKTRAWIFSSEHIFQ